MDFGEVAYWVEGKFDRNRLWKDPSFNKYEIRLVSKVNIWAKFDTKVYGIDFFIYK